MWHWWRGDVVEESGTIRAHVGRHQRFRKNIRCLSHGEYGKDAVINIIKYWIFDMCNPDPV